MKGVTLFVVFLFLVSFCAAVPEIKFQINSFQPTQTIIGTINNFDGELIREDLKIYEDRREVFFERDLAKINGTYYFYIIPPKEGNFSLKIENVLYNSSSGIASITLQKDFNVSKKINKNNKTEILTIRPGLYVGDSPMIDLINSGEEDMNLSIETFFISMSSGSDRRISDGLPSGFYFLTINSYEKFVIPIFNYGSTNSSYAENGSTLTNNYSGCLSVDENISLTHIVDKNEEYFINIENNCNFSLENITISSEFENIMFGNELLDFMPDEIKNVSLYSDISKSGVFDLNIDLAYENEKLGQAKITIFSFKNETSATVFNQTYNNPTKLSCEERNGTFCTQEQSCSSDNYDYYPENALLTCCFSDCVSINSLINWNNVIVGIVGVLIILGILYLLYRRSNKIKNANPEEKFKELDKRYQKSISGKKK